MTGLLRRPRYADVVGTLALVVATSGAAYAVHALPKNSVGPAQVRKSAIRSAEIKDGKVKGFDYADGWSITNEPVSGTWHIDNLKVTNHRGKADRLIVEIKLLNNNEVLATAECYAGDVVDKIPKDTTVTVECSSSDALPDVYNKITINDAF